MDNLDILDIRIIKSLLADLAVEIDSIKETVEGLEQSSEATDTKLNDICRHSYHTRTSRPA